MNDNQKSYPDRIRIIAEDIDSAVSMAEYEYLAHRLRRLANALEEKLKQEVPKKSDISLRSFAQDRMMIWSAGDLSIKIEFGLLYEVPGAILQRKERDGYHDYLVDGGLVINPFDEKSLPPGWYRLRDPS